ncbi:MAG: hypothetical protein HKN87_10470 [Saprospiraceae bacterium]|nr:hypothetical protein [Saprospiraceae bacterium]
MESIRYLILGLLGTLVNVGYTQSQQSGFSPVAAQDRLEMWEEPRHQLVFEKDQLKVMEVRIPPSDSAFYHVHRYPTIYVVINDAKMWSQVWGKDWNRIPRPKYRERGSISDLSYGYYNRDLYHRVSNHDTATLHLIAVLSTKEAPMGDQVESEVVDNHWFREHRFALEGKIQTENLIFSNPTIVIQCSEGESVIQESDVTHSTKTKAGAFSWHEAGSTFRIENISSHEQLFVVIEIK